MKIQFDNQTGRRTVRVNGVSNSTLANSDKTIRDTLVSRGVKIVDDFTADVFQASAEITADDLAAVVAAINQSDRDFVRPVCQSVHSLE